MKSKDHETNVRMEEEHYLGIEKQRLNCKRECGVYSCACNVVYDTVLV
jgi:hypothetical protein